MAASSTGSDLQPRSAPVTIGVCVLLAIAAFFLWEEHRAHVLGILPYLLLAACPLVHLFMHGRHGSHRHRHARHADRMNEGGRP
jgi:hypothetical protein